LLFARFGRLITSSESRHLRFTHQLSLALNFFHAKSDEASLLQPANLIISSTPSTISLAGDDHLQRLFSIASACITPDDEVNVNTLAWYLRI
jgi:hypothetical protein